MTPLAKAHTNKPLLEEADVPCNGCTACCRGHSLIMLTENDNPDEYETAEVAPGVFGLKFKPNGDCWYLADSGCSIHERAPFMCRIFDCRKSHAMYTRAERKDMVKRGLASAEVFKRAALMLQAERRAT